MSDSSGNGNGAGKLAPRRLGYAFDRAKAAKQALDKKPKKISSPHILRNIRRHKHMPLLVPKGPIREAVDRQNFTYYEALDRAEAVARRKKLEKEHENERAKAWKEPDLER